VLVAKQHRDYIPKQANWRASAKLELVHSDICGPIDDFSSNIIFRVFLIKF
jgi:hypothetical protein